MDASVQYFADGELLSGCASCVLQACDSIKSGGDEIHGKLQVLDCYCRLYLASRSIHQAIFTMNDDETQPPSHQLHPLSLTKSLQSSLLLAP